MNHYSPDILAGDFDEAMQKKHLPASSHASESKQSASSNRFDSHAFVRAIKTRLLALGYLGKKNRIDGKIDAVYERAVKRFQRSAGLSEVDAWVGRKTWGILDFLCSFENDQDPHQWLERWCEYCNIDKNRISFAHNEAVLRALYLRLYAYGFIDAEHALNSKTCVDPLQNSVFQTAINQFRKFCSLLDIQAGRKSQRIHIDLLRAVYSYDELMNVLAETENFKKVSSQFKTQLEAISRVELWLSGYETQPGPDKNVQIRVRRGAPGKRRVVKTKSLSQMQLAFEAFWKDNADELDGAESKDRISQNLFVVFKRNMENEDDVDDELLELEVSEILKNKKQSRELTNQFSRLANSIWDGAKRLVKNLFKWIKRKFKQSVRLIANLARYLSSQARAVFGYVKTAVEIVTYGLKFYSSGISQESKDGIAVFWQGKDFDQLAIIDKQATQTDLQYVYTKRKTQSKIYGAATRIFAHLVSIFQSVVGMFVSAFGWLRALLTLRRLARSVVEIKTEIDLIKSQVNTF